MEDLIKFFFNERDIVCDLTIGSCPTDVAAMNTGRNFIDIEKDDHYFEIAKKKELEMLQKIFWRGSKHSLNQNKKQVVKSMPPWIKILKNLK